MLDTKNILESLNLELPEFLHITEADDKLDLVGIAATQGITIDTTKGVKPDEATGLLTFYDTQGNKYSVDTDSNGQAIISKIGSENTSNNTSAVTLKSILKPEIQNKVVERVDKQGNHMTLENIVSLNKKILGEVPYLQVTFNKPAVSTTKNLTGNTNKSVTLGKLVNGNISGLNDIFTSPYSDFIKKNNISVFKLDSSNGMLTGLFNSQGQPIQINYITTDMTQQSSGQTPESTQGVSDDSTEMTAMDFFTRKDAAKLTAELKVPLKKFNEDNYQRGFRVDLGPAVKGTYKESLIQKYKKLQEATPTTSNATKKTDSDMEYTMKNAQEEYYKKKFGLTNPSSNLEFNIVVTLVANNKEKSEEKPEEVNKVAESIKSLEAVKLCENFNFNIPEFLSLKEDISGIKELTEETLDKLRTQLVNYLNSSGIKIKVIGTEGKQADQELKVPITFKEGKQNIKPATEENPIQGGFTIIAIKEKADLSGFSKAMKIAKAFGNAANLVNTTTMSNKTTKF